MATDKDHSSHTLEDAERYQRLFVAPLVERVGAEVKLLCEGLQSKFTTIETEQKTVRKDVDDLKANQKKALVGWGVFATGIAMACTFCWNWVKDQFKKT